MAMTKRILVVDDSCSLRTVARMTLLEQGYEVVEACDGKEGLKMLDGERVHLIISDVNMPTMDGISFLKEIKRHPSYKFTPVIMLTTEVSAAKKQEGRAAGAKAWITKPFDPAILVATVAKLIQV
jgi:two-component system chemotaxis response regulator CheY